MTNYLISAVQHPLWSFWSTLAAILFGGIVSWIATYFYFIKGSKNLTQKTEVLRKINNAMAAYLENCWGSDNVKFSRDCDGNVIQVVVAFRLQGIESTANTSNMVIKTKGE